VEDYHFADISDFLARIPGISQEDANIYLTVDCDVYKLELEGRVGRVRRKVIAVVQKGSGDSKTSSATSTQSNLVILRWQEET
jgi:hypothetical protein